MGVVYNGNNAMELRSIIHAETDTGFLATGYNPQITGLLSTGVIADEAVLKNHVVRELFRKMYNEGISDSITDPYDNSFRPTAFTGLYS